MSCAPTTERRLLDVTHERVTFATRHGKHTSLHPLVFLQRFLQHTLPHGFVRIRHYGLLASSNVNTRLERAREQLAHSGAELHTAPEPEPREGDVDLGEDTLVELVRRLCGVDLRRCPRCGGMRMKLRVAPVARGPPR